MRRTIIEVDGFKLMRTDAFGTKGSVKGYCVWITVRRTRTIRICDERLSKL